MSRESNNLADRAFLFRLFGVAESLAKRDASYFTPYLVDYTERKYFFLKVRLFCLIVRIFKCAFVKNIRKIEKLKKKINIASSPCCPEIITSLNF